MENNISEYGKDEKELYAAMAHILPKFAAGLVKATSCHMGQMSPWKVLVFF